MFLRCSKSFFRINNMNIYFRYKSSRFMKRETNNFKLLNKHQNSFTTTAYTNAPLSGCASRQFHFRSINRQQIKLGSNTHTECYLIGLEMMLKFPVLMLTFSIFCRVMIMYCPNSVSVLPNNIWSVSCPELPPGQNRTKHFTIICRGEVLGHQVIIFFNCSKRNSCIIKLHCHICVKDIRTISKGDTEALLRRERIAWSINNSFPIRLLLKYNCCFSTWDRF